MTTLHPTRGATSSPPSRYLSRVVLRDEDDPGHDQVLHWLGSDGLDPEDAQLSPPAPETQLLADRTVRLISRNQSPDIPFDRSINPYKGCEHGCVYCFARPTHAYLDLSPGLDFETRIFYKTRVSEALNRELASRGYQCRPIAMGTNTDPYQPAEQQLRNTRAILEVLLEHRHPVTIVTKSVLILRDLDVLQALAEQNLVHVNLSVTTLDNALKRRMEPRTASGRARVRTIEALSARGIPTGAMVAPVIPFINDKEIEHIVAAVAEAGARQAGYILLRLPLEVEPLMTDWLRTHYPQRADRVLNAIRGMRGGRLYRAQWGTRMRGTGTMAELIAARFQNALRKHGLSSDGLPPLDTTAFRVVDDRQQSLF